MYNHFVCQLSHKRLMDSKKKYKEQLDDIDESFNDSTKPSSYL